MKRLMSLEAFVAIAGAACAQELATTPKVEIGLDYSLSHATSVSGGTQITSNGGSGYVLYNLNRQVGLVADFGGYHNGTINGSLNGERGCDGDEPLHHGTQRTASPSPETRTLMHTRPLHVIRDRAIEIVHWHELVRRP